MARAIVSTSGKCAGFGVGQILAECACVHTCSVEAAGGPSAADLVAAEESASSSAVRSLATNLMKRLDHIQADRWDELPEPGNCVVTVIDNTTTTTADGALVPTEVVVSQEHQREQKADPKIHHLTISDEVKITETIQVVEDDVPESVEPQLQGSDHLLNYHQSEATTQEPPAPLPAEVEVSVHASAEDAPVEMEVSVEAAAEASPAQTEVAIEVDVAAPFGAAVEVDVEASTHHSAHLENEALAAQQTTLTEASAKASASAKKSASAEASVVAEASAAAEASALAEASTESAASAEAPGEAQEPHGGERLLDGVITEKGFVKSYSKTKPQIQAVELRVEFSAADDHTAKQPADEPHSALADFAETFKSAVDHMKSFLDRQIANL